MSVKLLTENHLESLSLFGGCTGSSESILVKMPHCWKLHVTAHLENDFQLHTLFWRPAIIQYYPGTNYLYHICSTLFSSSGANLESRSSHCTSIPAVENIHIEHQFGIYWTLKETPASWSSIFIFQLIYRFNPFIAEKYNRYLPTLLY